MEQDIDHLQREIDSGRSGQERIEPPTLSSPSAHPIFKPPITPLDPTSDQPVTIPKPKVQLGSTGSGGAGEGAKDRLQAQEPRPLSMTGKLLGAVIALAVMFLGVFGYFYLRWH